MSKKGKLLGDVCGSWIPWNVRAEKAEAECKALRKIVQTSGLRVVQTFEGTWMVSEGPLGCCYLHPTADAAIDAALAAMRKEV